jgi:hypothetical protein
VISQYLGEKFSQAGFRPIDRMLHEGNGRRNLAQGDLRARVGFCAAPYIHYTHPVCADKFRALPDAEAKIVALSKID